MKKKYEKTVMKVIALQHQQQLLSGTAGMNGSISGYTKSSNGFSQSGSGASRGGFTLDDDEEE